MFIEVSNNDTRTQKLPRSCVGAAYHDLVQVSETQYPSVQHVSSSIVERKAKERGKSAITEMGRRSLAVAAVAVAVAESSSVGLQ